MITAERVNALLTSAISFQQYFCIIDQDIERGEKDPTEGDVQAEQLRPANVAKKVASAIGTELAIRSAGALRAGIRGAVSPDETFTEGFTRGAVSDERASA